MSWVKKTLLRSVSRFLNSISSSLLELHKVSSLVKLHTSDNVITKNKKFTNIFTSKGPKIEPWGTPIVPRAIWWAYFRSLLTALSYRFHNIPIWLSEDCVVCNHVLLVNTLKLYPQIFFGLSIFARDEVIWINRVGYCVPSENHKV